MKLFYNLPDSDSVYVRELFRFVSAYPLIKSHNGVLMSGDEGYGIYLEEAAFDWWLSLDKIRENIISFQTGWVAAHLSR